MAAPASLLGHRYDPVPGAGNGPAHEQEISLGVHLDHPKTQLGVAGGALVTRHLLALDDARRIGAWADRAGLPVPRVAVTRRPAAEAVAVDYALKAAALGGAADLHQLAGGEDVHLDLRALRGRLAPVHREDPEHPGRGVQARLLGVAELGPSRGLGTPSSEAKLDAAVTHLHDLAGA